METLRRGGMHGDVLRGRGPIGGTQVVAPASRKRASSLENALLGIIATSEQAAQVCKDVAAFGAFARSILEYWSLD